MGTERIVVAAMAGIALGLSIIAVVKPAGGPAGEKTQATIADDAGFGTRVKAYLMANPQVLFEAARKYEEQETEQAQAKLQTAIAENKDRLAALPGQFIAGNPKAEITIVEFFDYHCAYCKTAMPTLFELTEKNDDIKIRFMEFPILRPESELASRAAIAANKQGKYVALHQAMMSAPGVLSEQRIFSIAQDVGLDLAQLKADMEAAETTKILEAHSGFAEQVGFDGTPGLIVGEKAMTGWSEETIHQYIAEQRKKRS